MAQQVPIKLHPTAFAAFGPDLVTSDVVALMELIKNSYDAYAYKVNILFDFSVSNPCIVVSDDGVGMTRETIENVWAVVATPYKRKNPTISRNGKIRRVSGNKGMGRFSSAKLGKKVDIYTKHKDDGFMHIQIDWNEILYSESISECAISIEETRKFELLGDTGTRIVISNLTSQWSESDYKELTENLSRIISPFEEISDFSIALSIKEKDSEEKRETLISPPEFIQHPVYKITADIDMVGTVMWKYSYNNPRIGVKKELENTIPWEEIYKNQIEGEISTSKRKLFSSSSANCGPFSLEVRAWDLDSSSITDISSMFDISKSAVRNALRAYKGISIYRDGVLVLPKSEASRDWIGLDTRRISDVGKRLSTSQMLGIIRISADDNPEIRDTTDREKLVDTKEHTEFCAIIRAIISQLENLRDSDRVKKRKEPSIIDILETVSPDKLVEHTKEAFESGKPAKDIVKIVEDYQSHTNSRLEDIKKRLYYYGQVATAGSMAAFILHEIRGGLTSVKRFLDTIIEREQTFNNKEKKNYNTAIESYERMILVANSFAPLYSTSFKDKTYKSNLAEELDTSISYLEDNVLKNAKITIKKDIPTDILIGLHPGEIQTIFVNLLDNAAYWIKQSSNEERLIVITAKEAKDNNKRIIVSISDSGTGVRQEYAEKIFEPGVTAKSHGIGMGLVIVAEILARHQGKIALQIPSETDGATFIFDIPLA